MAIVACDFETYYDKDYSLSKMSTLDYILDPRYQTILCCVKVDDGAVEVHVGHDETARRLSSIDWSRCAFLAHNTRFDGAIARWRYGVQPKLYLDTMGMARATIYPVTGSASLKSVSDYLGLPAKGDEVVRMMGRTLESLAPNELAAYADYCKRDTDNCRMAFDRLRTFVPASELSLIDLLLRMYIEPQVMLDPNVLAEHLADIRAQKAAALAQVSHIDRKVFSSNPQFARLLEEHGVDVPTKTSPTTGEEIYALAKNDRAFKELCEDDTQPPIVQALLAARLGTKSTLEEQRTEKLLGAVTRHQFPAPVPLKYYGAHTGRPSGDDGVNWLNFKRGAKVRAAIKAPEGFRIVHRDSSQIEARISSLLAGCQTLLEAFADGKRDPYCEFASDIYGRKITKADTKERFTGKVSILMLMYGSGHLKFRHTLFIGQGGVSVKIDENEARRIVYRYRDRYHEIPLFWSLCDAVLHIMAAHNSASAASIRRTRLAQLELSLPIVKYSADAIWLPNGMCLSYPNLRAEHSPTATIEILYDGPQKQPRKLYGGKTTENLCQALSRIIITDIASRVYHAHGQHPWLTTYDSLDYCVPVDHARWFDEMLEAEFAMRPSWAPGLPLASEGGFGVSLMDAEKRSNQ